MAGVAPGDIHLGFTWQAWHNLTSTVVLRGRRGTHGTGWRGDIHLRFAWQAWPLWHWAGCGVTRHLCHTPSFTHSVTHHLSHTIFDTPSFKTLSHTIFVTQHLSHTLFHTQLCHTPSLIHHLSHTTLSPTIFVLLLGPPPPPLSFLIGRSCLVRLSGPLIEVLKMMMLQKTVLFVARSQVALCRGCFGVVNRVL